jgi:hypothetical protein
MRNSNIRASIWWRAWEANSRKPSAPLETRNRFALSKTLLTSEGAPICNQLCPALIWHGGENEHGRQLGKDDGVARWRGEGFERG